MADSTLNVFLGRGDAATMAGLTPSPPTPASGPDPGYVFYNTDDATLYAWDGASWVVSVPGGTGTVTTTGSPASGNLTKFSGATAITNGDLSGDVTTSGALATTIATNAVTTAKINNSAVTLAKIANASANSKLVGSGAAGSGNPYAEISLGSGLSMTGTTLDTTGGSGTVTHTAGALTSGQLVYGNGSADLKVTAATDGQIPIGKTSDGTAALATITAGNGISVTNGANAITLATSTAQRTKAITFAIDGGGSALTTGIKADVSVPYAGTIASVTMLADQSGSVVVDIWKDTFANYPPTVADSIVASAPPTISSATNSQDSTLTGWTTSISANDTLRFNINSATTITRLNLTLKVTVS